MKKKPIILVDLDMTAVDMIKHWIRRYNILAHERILEQNILEYEIRKYARQPDLLDKILCERDFFFNMDPIKNSPKYMEQLVKNGYDVVIVTQPPRRASLFAVKDKRKWVLKYFPSLDLKNVIFCHRKDLVVGDILFDDAPSHIESWKKVNPKGITAKIQYKYNKHCSTDWTFSDKLTAWEKFYEKVKKEFPL